MEPVAEVRAYAFRLTRALHQRLGVRLPREISAQLYKAESPAHIAEILEREMGRVFKELKEDHPRLMAQEEGVKHEAES